MPRTILVLLICLLSICCLAAKKYKPQPIVVRELSTLSTATKVGSLCMFAEDYAKHSKFDFSKANLRAVQLTLQNTSDDIFATIHQFFYTDFRGIGNKVYMPYPYDDAFALMDNSIAFTESIKGAALGTLGGAIVGRIIGAAIGTATKTPGAATVGTVTGGAAGGYKGYGHYKNEAIIAVDREIQSRRIPDAIMVPPGRTITGVLFFPKDTHTIRINIEGTTYDLSIDNPRGNNVKQPRWETQRNMDPPINKGLERILEDYTSHVFASKFNNVFHRPNCSKMEDTEGLIRFDTPQKASEAGYLPCNYCNPS
ncbi:MAG: glycine zipper family protein [Candidatus Scalindua sp.]